MICIKNVHVYDPEDCGIQDLLIGGGKILKMGASLQCDYAEVVEGAGKICVPGFIDQHVHITGGGGEGGFATKTPEIQLSCIIEGGITTVLGLLGTDGYSRSVENLLSKAKGLKEEGISVVMTTGAYGYPNTTCTGSVTKDILFIEEVIGCKLALSDHRSSHVTVDELTRLASEVRVAGMLAKKAGILVLHMGDEASGLEPVNHILRNTDIPIALFRPTHVTRNESLFQQAIAFNQQGGYIDCTCGDETNPFAHYYLMAKEAGCDLQKITLSSDGQGSWSHYDSEGRCIEVGVSSVSALHEELKRMVLDFDIPLSEALHCITDNVARALALSQKGTIKIDSDADLVLLDESLNIDSVMANGYWMMQNKVLLRKGTFE